MKYSILKDRYIRGLVAGTLAGILNFPWNLFSNYINFSNMMWGDFFAALIFRRPIVTSWERIFAFIIVTLFLGFLGVIFSLLIPVTKSKLLWLKGAVFGVAFWFAIYSLTIMFRVPGLTNIPSRTALSNFFSAVLYGTLLGVFVDLIDKWVKQEQ